MDCSFNHPKSKSGLRFSVQFMPESVRFVWVPPVCIVLHLSKLPAISRTVDTSIEGSCTSSSSLNRCWSRKVTVTMLRVQSVLGLCIQLQLANLVNLDSESKDGLYVIEQTLRENQVMVWIPAILQASMMWLV